MKDVRVDKARQLLTENELDAFVVTSTENRRWLTGFTGSNGAALVTFDEVWLFTDGRYTIQSAEEASGAVVRISMDPVVKQAGQLIHEQRLKRVGFESGNLTVDSHRVMLEAAEDDVFVPLAEAFNSLRAVKDEEEITLLSEACRMTDEAYSQIIPFLKPGSSELDIERELIYILSKCGAEKESFDTIVASGPRSAMPHASPSSRVLQQGEVILLDFGAQHAGYTGDITRTMFTASSNDQFAKIYQIVLTAQMASIEAIKPGMTGVDVDRIARDIIAEAGYGDKFDHGLGHQIGLHVHDGPALSPRSKITLQAGMVVTVEPGVYLEGWGGIRIEDDVVITEDGCRRLTHSTKDIADMWLT